MAKDFQSHKKKQVAESQAGEVVTALYSTGLRANVFLARSRAVLAEKS